jgi:fructose-bisphosphate aldolase class II
MRYGIARGPFYTFTSTAGIMLVPTGSLFEHCYGNYAIAAINIWCLEQLHALFRAAERAGAPFIVQMTPIALEYGRAEMYLSMIDTAAGIYPETVYSIHLDHGSRKDAIEAISTGRYSSVMIDASHESYQDNVRITSEIVQRAHGKGVEVEAELGILAGMEDGLSVNDRDQKYTQPDKVEDFVSRTGCDSLAVAVGTSHGAYKFKDDQGLQFDILESIQKRLPGYPLVLHGGSSVSQEEIRRIKNSGASLGDQARGVSSEEIRKAIKYGICKINIATDSRILWTRVHREFFHSSPGEFDPLIPGKEYMAELQECFMKKFELLNATSRIKAF